jgi:predicted transcriptional regulator
LGDGPEGLFATGLGNFYIGHNNFPGGKNRRGTCLSDAEERVLVELLARTRMPRKLAVVLVLLATQEEATSRDIEAHTGLRQPEVSTAMTDLREREWVTKRDVKKEGKGRPLHAYRLAQPFPQIIREIVDAERIRIREIEEAIEALQRRVQAFASP